MYSIQCLVQGHKYYGYSQDSNPNSDDSGVVLSSCLSHLMLFGCVLIFIIK